MRMQIWFSKRANRRAFFFCLKFVVTLVVIFGGVYGALYSPVLTVQSVKFSADSGIDDDKRREVLAYVDELFADREYGISGRTRYLLRRDVVRDMLAERFTEFKRVDIAYEFFNVWRIAVEKREPFGTVCAGEAGECLFVDTDGIVYMRSRDGVRVGVSLYVRDALTVGEMVFAENEETAARDFGTLVGVVQELEENGLFVDQVAVRRDSRLAHIQMNNGIAVWMDASETLYETTRALYVVFQEVLDDESKRDSVISVDVRDPKSILYEEKE